MNLLELYRNLLAEYDRILSLSRMILSELETGGGEENLDLLLQRKQKAGGDIARLTNQIACFEVKDHRHTNLEMLSAVKPLLKQIEEKAKLLQEVERRIQNLVRQQGRR